jgi:hypothetical protein
MSYEYIYMLKPVKEVSPGWWKLRWKPIKHRGYDNKEGTWNFYVSKLYKWHRSIGFTIRSSGEHNGWGRSYDAIGVEIALWFFRIDFWVKYNIIVCKDGPQDVAEEDKKPIEVPKKDNDE